MNPRTIRVSSTILIAALTLFPVYLITNSQLRRYFPIFLKDFKDTQSVKPLPKKCTLLQQRINDILEGQFNYWGVTVLDDNRNLIAAINASKPFVPASNVKLMTSAYALDKLGKDFRLYTKLFRRNDGVLEIWGEGDPDLSIEDLKQLSYEASIILKRRIKNKQPPLIIIYEEPSYNWWSDTWHPIDRLQSYGSPVTRLALLSNSSKKSILSPLTEFKTALIKEIKSNGVSPIVKTKLHKKKSIFFSGRKLIAQIPSSPMLSLLSLVNSESHNFTAEMLLRQSADTWDPYKASDKVNNWLELIRIPVSNFSLVDGSGLSRDNKLTSLGIASLLWYMDNHKFSSIFQSSMAIIGLRGTLINYDYNFDYQIDGTFYGKTGTLTGVKALSGIMVNNQGKKYISIISNEASEPDSSIIKLLHIIDQTNKCN